MRLYRKDHPPCEDELAARRRGEPWNEQIKQKLQEQVRNISFGNIGISIFVFRGN